MNQWFITSAVIILFAAAACGATETNVSPVPCGEGHEPCNPQFICARLALDEGNTLPLCVREVSCGEVECASQRCAELPGMEPAVECVVDEPDAGAP